MHLFVKARHWQIATMQIIPLICIFVLGDIFSPWQLGFMWVLLIGITVVWLYSIGTVANRSVDQTLQKNPMLFSFSALATVLVFILVLVMMYRASELQLPPPGWLIYVLFTGLGSFFYTLWFAASQLVAAEKQAEPFYIEYAFPMLGFWFGVVGVWFLQPRVNRVLGSST